MSSTRQRLTPGARRTDDDTSFSRIRRDLVARIQADATVDRAEKETEEHPLYGVIRAAEDASAPDGTVPDHSFSDMLRPARQFTSTPLEGWPGRHPFADYMASLNPVGWWRLGDRDHFHDLLTAVDSSAYGNDGEYRDTPGLFQEGALHEKPNFAVRFENEGYVEVPDSVRYSLTRAYDWFNREGAIGASWGTSSSGHVWQNHFPSAEQYYNIVSDGDSQGYGLIREYDEGTYQQGIDVHLSDCDIQVRAMWDALPTEGKLKPVALVARRQGPLSFYRAQLEVYPTEDGNNRIELALYRTCLGKTAELGRYEYDTNETREYESHNWWYLRFQLEGATLRAKAWPKGDEVQSSDWDLDVTDSLGYNELGLGVAGDVAIRSSNSGSGVSPFVYFEGFRVQTLGMTVHAFFNPASVDNFRMENPEDQYVMWLGKGEVGQQEWGFRFYESSAVVKNMSGDDEDRSSRLSAYMFNLEGGLGAGAFSQFEFGKNDGPEIVAGEWYHIVATFDSGDAVDLDAGVTLYVNGIRTQNPAENLHARYSFPRYKVYPRNGSAPVRFATRDGCSYFDGWLDEIAIFDRKLGAQEIRTLYRKALGRPILKVGGVESMLDQYSLP